MPNVTVYDLENYPDNGKTVTVALASVVPVGAEGDERWVISSSTTGYSDITNRTAIQDVYIRDIKAGWAKSSGLKGSTFTISGTNRTLGVKMDAITNTYYITLTQGTNLSGDAIADDMETQIRAIPDGGAWNSSDSGYELSYKNASVDFTNNRFTVVAGSMGSYYTGANRTAVVITASGADTAYTDLGFSLGNTSQTMAGLVPKEVALGTSYTTDTSPMTIGAGTGVVEGSALYITDGTNSDYFIAISGTTDTSVVVATAATHNYTGVAHSYTAGAAKVQVLQYGDPESVPVPYYTNVDSLVRFGIKTMANQLDYSS
jgi:hypothetical protein